MLITRESSGRSSHKSAISSPSKTFAQQRLLTDAFRYKPPSIAANCRWIVKIPSWRTMDRSRAWQQCAKLHRRTYWLHKGITFRLFVRSRADQRYVSPRTPARLRDSASVDSSMPIFQHSAGSRGGSRFPGHIRYRSLHARARPFVTRFSRIGSNAIHEGWRVPAWSASRARYRSVRETCAACTYYYRGNRYCFPGLFSHGAEWIRTMRSTQLGIPFSIEAMLVDRTLGYETRGPLPAALTFPATSGPASSRENTRATVVLNSRKCK